jgi:RimJ/RimL family protein N-acetyltransferase
MVVLLNDPRVARSSRFPHPYSRREGLTFIRLARARYRDGRTLFLTILDRERGHVLGGIGLDRFDWTNRSAEIGYWIARRFWGHGLATEAVASATRTAFRDLKLHRIVARVLAHNAASARVLEKAGFRLEGRQRHAHRDRRGWVDELGYAILNGELSRRGSENA